LKISPDHRPSGFEQHATFQPTFLYEIIWNLALAGFLIWLGNRRRIKPPGLMALYVAGYSAFRLFEEQLRIDYSVHVLGMRLNFWIALLVCLAGLAWFAWIQKRGKTEPLPLDGPKPDARQFARRGSSGYRKPAVPTYGKSGARPAPDSGGGSRRRR
jgi:prolipoprotein diacylglyceryltransferase